MSVTYPKSGLQDSVAFQQNGKPGVYPVQSWNDEIGTFQFASGLEEGYTIPTGMAVFMADGADGVRLPQSGDAIAAGVTAAAKTAQGSLTFVSNPLADATVTVGEVTYKFVEAVAAANDVKLGATVSETAANLVAAINAGVGIGEVYGAGTVANEKANALLSENNVVTVFAGTPGAAGNAVALASSGDAVTVSGATLAGGADAGAAVAANAKFVGVSAFSYFMTVQTDGYSKSNLDVNIPVKQKGYINVRMSSLTGAKFGVLITPDMAVPGKFKVAADGDPVVGKINKVFPDYQTCEVELKEFI